MMDTATQTNPRKAVLFVPFWRQKGHVGNNRVDRFLRWLAEDGYRVTIIRAGSQQEIRDEGWGEEITVVDRLGLHRDAAPSQQANQIPARKPNKLRRAVAYRLFNPDPTIVWAKAAARNPQVIAAMEGASFILSSSPPESAHVGAWMLSQKTGVPHIMDMRDGWLDEPLKPLLLTSAFRRWQEGRLESRIARAAEAIQVTSDVWKELFDARYPQLADKVHVLTNGYPRIEPVSPNKQITERKDELLLIHAGRFTGSRLTQRPELLLDPLLRHLSASDYKGKIQFYGNLAADELALIEPYKKRFSAVGWQLECPGAVPRAQILDLMQEADGLLLLSASHAALPSKLFEYVAIGKSIFYVAESDGAADRLLHKIPQATNLTADEPAIDFDDTLCRSVMPPRYSEIALKDIFSMVVK